MTARNTITVHIPTNRDGIDWKFPCKWVICWSCEGHATTTRHIEPDGGGFTASEFAEAIDGDPDFADDYFGGRYDEPCPACKGLGRVQEIDTEQVTSWRDKIALKAYHAHLTEEAAYRAECEAERRMGV